MLPLREQGDWRLAQQAHLALGIALRARGDLPGARRELLAAAQVSPQLQASGRLIVGFELAELNALRLGDDASEDLRGMIRYQAHELWRQRLQRVGMLRQARQREEQEQARRLTESALMHDPRRGWPTAVGSTSSWSTSTPAGSRSLPSCCSSTSTGSRRSTHLHSHTVGDQVLREIAAVLKAHCRAGDVPIRYAGDEFVIFLQADLDAARSIADRIRAAVRDTDLHHVAPGLRVSVSIGATALRPDMTARQLFDEADTNLYRAKRGGRNRVAV